MVDDKEGDLSSLAGFGGTSPRLPEGEGPTGSEQLEELPQLMELTKFLEFSTAVTRYGLDHVQFVIDQDPAKGSLSLRVEAIEPIVIEPGQPVLGMDFGKRKSASYQDVTVQGGPTIPLRELLSTGEGTGNNEGLNRIIYHAAGIVRRLSDMRERQERDPLEFGLSYNTLGENVGRDYPPLTAAIQLRATRLTRPPAEPTPGVPGPTGPVGGK